MIWVLPKSPKQLKNLLFKIFLLGSFFTSYAQVSADFNADNTVGCAPFVINFMDISTGGNSWTWDFGNGVTSNMQNPTYVYSQPGFYTVTLTVSNGSSTDTEVKSSLIRVNASPIANFTVNDQTGCSPHIAEFTDISIPTSGTVTEWFWAFGNGETSTEQHPLTTYSEIKNYDVFLKVKDVNGCESSVSKSDFILLDGPEAKFVYDSVVCGLPANVTFLNQSIGNNLEYLWDFGDGSTSTGNTPGTHTYNSFDSTEVSLVVTEQNTGCSDTVRSSLVVGNYEASFDWNIICGYNEYTIEVENTTDFYSTIEWDFGGESTVFTKNASHHFNSSGPHEITLKATVDPSCWDTTTITYNIPVAYFNFDAPICQDPFEVTFTNTSIGEQLTYFWDFGDSTFSQEPSPIHTFDLPPEIFEVFIMAEDIFGCRDTGDRKVPVPFPIARIEEVDSIYTGCAPLDLTFRDISYTLDSKVSSVEWNFGDPTSGSDNFSTDTMPSHIYNSPGNYDIEYIIFTNDGCSDTATFKGIIKAGEKPISASFEQITNDSICYGGRIDFTKNETYATNWIESNYFCWGFYGDGNPYLVDENEAPADCPAYLSTSVKEAPFVFHESPHHVYKQFDFEGDTINNIIYTGDISARAGNLTSHLIVGYNNCFTEVINPTFVDTTIGIVGYGIPDSLVLFSDSTIEVEVFQKSLNYDSVDFALVINASTGDTLSSIHPTDTAKLTFDEGNIYHIKMKVINKESGCENTITDIFTVDSVRLDFNMIDRVCVDTNNILLEDQSRAKFGSYRKRQWKVNGNPISVHSPNKDSSYYTFPDTGKYIVTMEVTYNIEYTLYGQKRSALYTKSTSKEIMIEGVKARGYSDTLIVCGGETIQFTDTSSSTNLLDTYEWRFGYDTDSSTLKKTSHTYDFAGEYLPKLFVKDTFGCQDSLILPAIKVNRPFIDFEVKDSLICKGDVIDIKNKSEGESLSFTWTADSTILQTQNFSWPFDSAGFFDVKLHAIDLFGCEDSLIKENKIEVSDFPKASFEGNPIYIDCPPLTSNFGDSSVTPVIEWQWDFGDEKTSTDQHPTHIYTTPGKYDVSLIVTNYARCEDTLIKTEYVEIDGPNGTLAFDPDTLCIPDSVTFDLDFENTVYYILTYGDGSSVSYTYANNPDTTIHVYKDGGLFQPKVELIDATGCFYTLPELPKIWGDSIKAQFETISDIICDVSNIPFTNTSRYTYNSSYVWDFGDNNISTEKNPVHSYLIDSTYIVKLTQTSPLGCIDSISKTLTVFNAPFPQLHVENENFCIPSQTNLKLQFGNDRFIADSIYFTLNNMVIPGDSINYNFTTAATHDIQFTIEYGTGNCLTDSVIPIQFYKFPIANFNYSPTNNSVEEPVIFFENLSENSTIWSWDFDDFESSSIQNPGHSFDFANLYNVSLIASNDGGCFDTIVHQVSLSPYNFVKLPSAFSPNGDGKNETFSILRAGELELIEFKIFNRWGNVVFETSDVNEAWDGTRKGKEQNSGTYIYYVKGKRTNGEIAEIKGNFTLIR